MILLQIKSISRLWRAVCTRFKFEFTVPC